MSRNKDNLTQAQRLQADMFGGEVERAQENDHLGSERGSRRSPARGGGRRRGRGGGRQSDGALRQFLINELKYERCGAPSSRYYQETLKHLRAIERRNGWEEAAL